MIAPAPPGLDGLKRLAAELLVIDPRDLRPEPGESFVYVLLVLLSPLVIAGAAWGARRLTRPGPGRADAALVALVLAVAGAVVAADPASAAFRLAPLVFAGLVLLAAGLAAADRRLETWRFGASLAAGLAFVGGATLMLAASWRDARSLAAPMVPFEAFAYSIVASAHGRTCLIDLPTQYGCYGAALGPVLRVVGATVSHITLLAVTLSAAALAAVAVFAGRTLRSPILAAGVVLALAVATLRTAPDLYFQYLPLRVLFPALSLLAILWWEAKPGAGRAVALGAFGAAAVFWNPDAGFPVLGAVGLYVVAAGASGAGGVRRRVVLGALYAGSALATGLLLLLALAVAGHGAPDLGSWLDYHRIFIVSGLSMLPMAPPPAAWTVCVALAVGALAWFAVGRAQGAPPRRADHAAFLAVLAIGLFSYFVGRSHPDVLVCVAWPFLILAFLLLDAARPGSPAAAFALRWVGAVLVLVLVATALRDLPSLHPKPPAGPDATAEDVAFVRDHSARGAPLALLASKETIILGQLGRASALPGPGYAELLTRRDADALFDWLVAKGPRDVFVSADLIWSEHDLTGLSYWIAARLPRLNPVYTVEQFGPGGRLLHFVRKPAPLPPPRP